MQENEQCIHYVNITRSIYQKDQKTTEVEFEYRKTQVKKVLGFFFLVFILLFNLNL